MRIRRLLLQSFGCLQGEFHFSADRANLVVEPNEMGKSTLAAALLAGLYGFPPGQRRSESRPFTDLELHRPWEGEGYLVEMDVEAAGEVFTVRRDFGARKEQVFEWRSGKEITGRFQKSKDCVDLAGTITGLDRESFARTVFLRQSEMQQVRDADGITAALQRMATSQEGDVAASEATGILTESLRQYRGRKIRRGKVESEISGIEEEIGTLQSALEAMERRRASVEEELRELESTSRKADEIDAEIEQLEYLIIAAGRAEDQKRLEEESADRQELEAREKEFQELSRYESFPSSRRGRLTELRARLGALAESEEKIREKMEEEVRRPLEAARASLEEMEGLDRLTPEEIEELPSQEADLAAAWRSERKVRRGLRLAARKLEAAGEKPGRIREMARRYGELSPEDRKFLLDYGLNEAEARRALENAERDAGDLEEDLDETRERVGRARSLRTGILVAGAAALAGAALLWFLGPAWLSLLAGVAGAVLIALRFTMFASGEEDRRLESILASRKSTQDAREEQEEAFDSLRSRLDEMAAKAGAGDGETFLEEFRESQRLAEESGELAALDRALAEARESFQEAAAPLRDLMERAGHTPRFGALTPGTVRRFRRLAESRVQQGGEISSLEERAASFEKDLAGLEEERAGIRSEIAEILREAGLDPGLEPEPAEEAFNQGVRQRERYELLKKEIIPDLVRRSMGRQDKGLSRRIEESGLLLRRMEERSPALAGLEPSRSHKEYIEERDRLRKESRAVAERRLELAHQLGEVLKEYRRDYPTTQSWLRDWELQRSRALAFKESVEMARAVLEDLSREAYAEWADVLNERASEALAYLSPGYEDLRFDQDLTFTLREAGTRERRTQEDVDVRFSAGARDQIYLAARLAMAGYLSAGTVKLPIILDDPFATFDDERFARAMTVMLEKFSKRHQLIILSCHEARHRSWQDRHPELFADRVRIMSLHPVAS